MLVNHNQVLFRSCIEFLANKIIWEFGKFIVPSRGFQKEKLSTSGQKVGGWAKTNFSKKSFCVNFSQCNSGAL